MADQTARVRRAAALERQRDLLAKDSDCALALKFQAFRRLGLSESAALRAAAGRDDTTRTETMLEEAVRRGAAKLVELREVT
jgi:hypothetical protein